MGEPSESEPAAGPEEGQAGTDTAGPDIEAVLRGEERARAGAFFRAFSIIAGSTAAFLPFLPGAVWLRAVAGAGTALGVGLCLFALHRIGKDHSYTDRFIAVIGAGCAVAAVSVVYYVGLFSAASMALSIGVYFFAASQSRLAARLTYGTVACLYFVLTAALAAGLVPDDSLFPIALAAPVSRWFQAAMSQVILAVTFYLARSNRRTMEGALDRVSAAAQQIRQRDAQLAEARRELDRALRPSDGRRSRETLGDYKLGALLGRGGMGEVYAAEHARSGARVAVKVVHPHVLESPDLRKRFLREAQIAASVKSPHVVDVVDMGETGDGVPYLAMELLDGNDLGWILRKTGKLSLGRVVEIVTQVSRALVVMREAGIVHRDLKPGNLFLARREAPSKAPEDSRAPFPLGTWKVLDFGLSKAAGTQSSLTHDELMGTPAYMAPEQVRGHATHASDLYAVAAIAYRAITGSVPFEAEDVANVIFKVAYEQPPSPAQFVRLPSDVELVLAIGLAKAEEDRFGKVEDFAEALRKAVSGDLDDALRRRGWQLLKRAPWGSSRSPLAEVSRPAA